MLRVLKLLQRIGPNGFMPVVIGAMAGVKQDPRALVDERNRFILRWWCRTRRFSIPEVSLLDAPAVVQVCGDGVHHRPVLDPPAAGKKGRERRFIARCATKTCLVSEGFLDERRNLVERVDRPAPHRDFRAIVNRVEVDRVGLVLLAPHFAEVFGMKALPLPVPVVE